MEDQGRHRNLPAVLGFVALGALTIWCMSSFTPWFDHLPFSPWWLLAAVVVAGDAILVLTIRRKLVWYGVSSDTDLVLAAAAAAVVVVSVPIDIALSIWLRPWLEGLPFSYWWMVAYAVPVFAALLVLVLLLEADGLGAAIAWSFGLLATAALEIAFLWWLQPWLTSLSFSPWLLVVPVLALFGILVLLAGWAEWTFWPLMIPAIALGVPLLAATSPLWALLAGIFELHSGPEEEAPEEPRPTGAQGPWLDTPIRRLEYDQFYFRDYAWVLADRIREASTPLTLGIFGRWGSGKTSLMQLIELYLQSAEKRSSAVETFWINVWQFDDQEQVWHAFLQSLLSEVHRRLPVYRRLAFDARLFAQRVRWGELAQTLLVNSYRGLIAITPVLLSTLFRDMGIGEVSQLVALALDPYTAGGASLLLGLWLLVWPAVKAAREVVSLDLGQVLGDAPYEQQISVLQRLRTQFQGMVRRWVGKEGRLVVFIDDLDRCTPAKIPEVLEALKLFTTVDGCVYVLAFEQEVVLEGVMAKHKFDRAAGLEYLEKIIQIPFHMPPLDEDKMERFIANEYPDVIESCENAARILSVGIEPNPRKIKRALNTYRTLYRLAQVREDMWEMDPVWPELLVKMVVVQGRFPELHAQLVRQPGLICSWETWALAVAPSPTERRGAGQEVEAEQPERFFSSLAGLFKGGRSADKKDDVALPESLARLKLPERARLALARALALGEVRFAQLRRDELEAYIYLTSTAEETTGQVRPNRQEREALFGGQRAPIESTVAQILARGRDPAEREQIKQHYVERLDKAIDDNVRFSQPERESANATVLVFEGLTQFVYWRWLDEYAEPHLLRVPAGPYAVPDWSEADHEMMRYLELSDYDAVVERLSDQPELQAFTQAYRGSVEAKRRIRELSYDRPSAVFGERFLPGLEPRQAVAAREVDLDAFYIGRYPVTNGRYQEFVGASGYAPPSHWVGSQPPEERADHPVTHVSWQDALSYCRWLSEQTGRTFRLPTEAEWEKAARGRARLLFPWGNASDAERCNTYTRRISGTTPVSSFSPKGESPYLAADMVGNVWEWTSTLYADLPYDPSDGREDPDAPGPRVLRGGSYLDVLGFVWAGARHSGSPDLRLDNVGFRVVMES
jgi:formylglycine-generating enzyme required for sulfatase activity